MAEYVASGGRSPIFAFVIYLSQVSHMLKYKPFGIVLIRQILHIENTHDEICQNTEIKLEYLL